MLSIFFMLVRIIINVSILIFTPALGPALGPAFPIYQPPVNYSGIIESQSRWIAGLQQPSGAIVMARNGERLTIEPYFANLAVTGMLEDPSPANLYVAERWIVWYLNHLNTPCHNGLYGTIYVHYVDTTTGNEYSAGRYDSTDSYGATFLTLLRKYYEVSGNRSLLLDNRIKIEMVASSVIATQQQDGLCYARPDFKIKYTMDNSEVYRGFKDMEWLMRNVFSDPARANYYRDRKLACYGGMETYLWDNIAQNYRKSACTPTGGTDWTVFYADATCQLFPIWNGVIPPDSRRAEHLFSMFNTYHPGWPYLRTADPFPWAILCYSAAKMGDKYRVDTFLNNVRAKYIDAGHPWTWYNNEAGFTIRAARAMRDIYNLALNRIVSIPSDVPLCLASDVSNVNDGKLFTEWTMITANNDGAWIKIDLAASKQLNRVLIKWGADRALTYKVQLSDDGINFIDVYTVSSGKEGTDDVILDRVHMKKYIRLLFDELPTNKITIREVEIYYEPENLALGKTATASSNQSNTYKSIDGDTSTRWESSFIDFMPWYTVDLGSITDINKVIIDWEASYAAAYSVQTSMDGRRFTTVYSTLGGDGGVDTIRFPTIGARHIKVLCTRRVILSGISFWEVRVYNNIN